MGALGTLRRLRQLVVHGRHLRPTRKALDALAPCTNLTSLTLLDPYFNQMAMAGMGWALSKRGAWGGGG